MRTVAFPPKPGLAEMRQSDPPVNIWSEHPKGGLSQLPPVIGLGGRCQQHHGAPSTPVMPVLLKSTQGVLGAMARGPHGNARIRFHFGRSSMTHRRGRRISPAVLHGTCDSQTPHTVDASGGAVVPQSASAAADHTTQSLRGGLGRAIQRHGCHTSGPTHSPRRAPRKKLNARLGPTAKIAKTRGRPGRLCDWGCDRMSGGGPPKGAGRHPRSRTEAGFGRRRRSASEDARMGVGGAPNNAQQTRHRCPEGLILGAL